MINARGYPVFFLLEDRTDLRLPDLEHLRAAGGAGALSRGPLVLHGNGLGVLYLSLGTAFHAVTLHLTTPVRFVL